ncbi:leucine-rich repeat receptor-like kinase [Striga asiatica]|uniref:Leucine-rich repeat receptor-like kinase n=1 Tax=Striga asiatica TaxID=4170 RepID=A0A5A7NYM7_STRAF|nr:leucine-rich repeat receptor-like kinase [Striga asiatica]
MNTFKQLNGYVDPTEIMNAHTPINASVSFKRGILPEISALHCLHLDLSTNNLRDPIPPQLANLTRLITLHLQNNKISGPIPNFLSSPPPNLIDLNLSNNELYEFLPNNLILRYGSRRFARNQALCSEIPLFPSSNSSGQPFMTMSSNPSSFPPSQTAVATNSPKKHHKKLGNSAIMAIAMANSVVIASFTVPYCCEKSCR